jgi:hypothetical protein
MTSSFKTVLKEAGAEKPGSLRRVTRTPERNDGVTLAVGEKPPTFLDQFRQRISGLSVEALERLREEMTSQGLGGQAERSRVELEVLALHVGALTQEIERRKTCLNRTTN